MKRFRAAEDIRAARVPVSVELLLSSLGLPGDCNLLAARLNDAGRLELLLEHRFLKIVAKTELIPQTDAVLAGGADGIPWFISWGALHDEIAERETLE